MTEEMELASLYSSLAQARYMWDMNGAPEARQLVIWLEDAVESTRNGTVDFCDIHPDPSAYVEESEIVWQTDLLGR